MRQELSSRHTWVYRWGIPGCLTLVALGAIWEFGNLGTPEPAESGRVATGIIIAAVAMIVSRILDRAKRVWLDDGDLIVADFRRETRVSCDNIVKVRTLPFFWPHRIQVRFKKPTVFGDSIVFFPPLKFGRGHPVVRVLGRKSNS